MHRRISLGHLRRAGSHLRLLRQGLPGTRFQDYRRSHPAPSRRDLGLLLGCLGVLLVFTGLITYPIPGPPSTLMILLGAALMARASDRAACLLDATELRIRRNLSYPMRAAVLLLTALAVGAACYWYLVGR